MDESSCSECEEGEELVVHRGRIENLLTARRVLKIAAILLVFLVSASILVASVIYDLAARRSLEFEEFSCSASDSSCLLSLCPKGMVWQTEQQTCSNTHGQDTRCAKLFKKKNIYIYNFLLFV